jgi:hypothetical protein
MNSDFLRREWGAIAFLVATALGVVVVPVGLNLNRRNVPAATESLIQTSPSPGASVSPSAAASTSPSASPVASPSPSPVPTPSPSDTSSPAPSPSAS